MGGLPRGDAEIERRLVAIAAPGLDGLSTEQLASAVLDRVREVLDADTSALLVVEPSRTHLTAAAARGLEDEVLQGFRLAIGAGFSGHVAATRQPAILDEIVPGSVANPLHHRPRAALDGRRAAGRRRHVGRGAPRRVGADGPLRRLDLVALQMVGEQLATALFAEQAAAERSAARTLQRSLLPGRLPSIDGIEMA